MKRWMRVAAVGVAGLLGALVTAVGAVVWNGHHRLNAPHRVAVDAVTLPDDARALQRGEHLYRSIGCGGCHGADGAGRTLYRQGSTVLHAPQIAPGAGSAIAGYRGEDWVRAIRHGVGRSGTALLMMPSVDYQRLSDADLGAVAAYVQRLPSVHGDGQRNRFGWLMLALVGTGVVPTAPAKLQPGVQPSAAIEPAASVGYGRYLATICTGCHGPTLAGGRIPGMPPGTPPAPDLGMAGGGVMIRYAELADFRAMLKSGRRPDGTEVAVMPIDSLSKLSDTDTQALHLYLKQLPAASARAP